MVNTTLNIDDPDHESAIHPLWRQAFRPFFLFATVFSVLCILVWILFLNGKMSFTPLGGAIFWHGHEMLFGFVGGIIVGFLLTAVQNWTGLRATHGTPLLCLFLVWLVSRILMFIPITSMPIITVVFDVGFYLFATILMANLIFKTKNYRNFFFIPVLLLIATGNFTSHLAHLSNQAQYALWGLKATTFLVALLMIIISGRVIPMFTANGTNTEKSKPIVWIEYTVIIVQIIIVALYLTNIVGSINPNITGAIFLMGSVFQSIRMLNWKPWVTIYHPLVWSLHLAYSFIPLSMGLFAIHYFTDGISFSAGLHSLTAGAMGTLILAMISRVSLGHSGRSLTLHPCMKYAFYAISLAGFIRIIYSICDNSTVATGLTLAGILWILAYSCFILIYTPILITARADGRPG